MSHPSRANMMPVDELARLFRMDAATGDLFWRARPREYFSSDRSFSVWNARYAGKRAKGGAVGAGHVRISVAGRNIYAHRIVFALHMGRWPVGFIDHINGDKLDNRISNLREASKPENMRNCPPPRSNTSGYCGVSWVSHRRKWRAYIQDRHGRRQHLGCFDDAESAARAYDESAAREHGAFARLNFPTGAEA